MTVFHTFYFLFAHINPVRKINAIVFSLIFLLGAAPGCRLPTPDLQEISATERPRPAAETPLRIGTSGDYPPFSQWPADASEPQGFSTDVARAWAVHEGRSIEWVRFVWRELEADLAHPKFDLALSGVTIRPDRSIAGRFSLPLTTSGAVALVESESSVRTRADLERPNTRIAVNAGGHLERVARALFPLAEIQPISKNQNVLDQLGQDDVHVILTDSVEAPLWQSKRSGLRAIGPLTRDRKAAWFGLAEVTHVRCFDRWLLSAEVDGTLAALRAKAGLSADPTAHSGRALIARLDERLSLMAEVARSKQIRSAPIEDPAREERVLAAAVRSVGQAAEDMGVSAPQETAVRSLYRAQIEAAKWIQARWLAEHPLVSPSGSPEQHAAAEARLDQEIRPALIFLGDRIATLLITSIQDATASERTQDFVPIEFAALANGLARHALPETHLRELHGALHDLEVGSLGSPDGRNFLNSTESSEKSVLGSAHEKPGRCSD